MPLAKGARLRPDGPVRTLEPLSFRDDHDAAISRIAALEHELSAARDDAREKSQRDRARIAMLEREIDELRHKEPGTPRRAPPPSTPPAPKVAPAASVDELAHRGPAISRLLLAFIFALAAGVMLLVYFVLRSDPQPVQQTCVVNTAPFRAHVIGFANAREVNLGLAPVEMRFGEWAVYDKLELRLPGWETMPINPPRSIADCPSDAYDLIRR
jgi:hypothetical protein